MNSLYYETKSGKLYLGDALDILPQLENSSIDMAITSPPYWQQRQYVSNDELGQESNFNDYIYTLAYIFSKLAPKLKAEGSLFVNIGDKYFTKNPGSGGHGDKSPIQVSYGNSYFKSEAIDSLLPQGALIGIPHLFVVEMMRQGWILKHTIIWHKPNAFPTSNKKKFTVDYEFLFHFILDPQKYYFEQQFEPSTQSPKDQRRNILRSDANNLKSPYANNAPRVNKNTDNVDDQIGKRNKRSVWSIPIGTERDNTEHIAMYPKELVRTPILACCPEGGTVLDPFMGSGTTALVCQELNRKWIGIELSKDYCDVIVERLKNASEK